MRRSGLNSDHARFAGHPVFTRRKRKYRRWLILLASTVILAFVATAVMSFMVGWKLTHPTHRPLTRTPSDMGLSYKNVTFPARTDNLSLSAWLIPNPRAYGRIVIEAHGYHENRSLDKPALPLAKALHDAGFAVLMFDFRDEGKSPGQFISVGLYEQRDLLGAIDYARRIGYKHVGLLGFSMGASTALLATAKDPHVEATVADSPFANLASYLQDNLSVWTHLPKWPFTPEVLWEMTRVLGIDPTQVNPAAALIHMPPRPILLIAGTADTTIPMENSKQLYREISQNRDDQLWIVPGAKHVGAFTVEPKVYTKRVVQFFQKYLG
ncbi:MAG: lysophospholipase [Alicyclobacillus herbarius]|uniref:alpha/beta hydrolase n=1 Tax=Alicyclobacillus herbarius TaxID=122960 RepID=UPI0023525E64|nr:alpha/beta fold hydrolase [Alicyclobacillus herbarius]MCL6631009.1 lysophospholipase [Alicyclobacillus herbarius]